MSSSQYGRKLNPHRRLREPLGVKGTRQSVVNTNTPSKIDQNEQLRVSFPSLGVNDVIIPGTVRLAFSITLKSTDANRTVVKNLGRAVVKKMTIKISNNEVLSVDDCDVYNCYNDLWRTPPERHNMVYQGINSANISKLRVGADDADAAANDGKDAAVAQAYGNRYYVPLDFELLEAHAPFYQSGLGDSLEYEFTFNEYSRVVIATGDAAASYTIDGISLEFDKVTQPDLARLIRNQYASRSVILYDRVQRHRKIPVNKSDPIWNVDINVATRSMKGILMLFIDPTVDVAYARDTEAFYNPKITNVEVTIEGEANQLYARGMRSYQQWDEARKHFGGGPLRHTGIGSIISKDLHLGDTTIEDYLTTKYALWLDLRTTDDDALHGSGRRILNGDHGISMQITKMAEAAGPLNMYIYIIMDAQLNFGNGGFVSAIY